MDNKDRLITLKVYLSEFANEFKGTTFKFEFNPNYNCALVSYSCPPNNNDDFWKGLVNLFDKVASELGDLFAAFTEDEERFHVSANAEIIPTMASIELNNDQFIMINEDFQYPEIMDYSFSLSHSTNPWAA
jgi:hypothetical protein